MFMSTGLNELLIGSVKLSVFCLVMPRMSLLCLRPVQFACMHQFLMWWPSDALNTCLANDKQLIKSD